MKLFCGPLGWNSIKSKGRVSLTECTHALEFARNLGQFMGMAVFGDDYGVGREQFGGAEKLQRHPIFVDFGVRGIEEHQIESCAGRFRCQLCKRFRGLQIHHSRTGANIERLQILADQCRRWTVLLHKYRFACAAAQRFDSNRTGAGEQIEETRTQNAIGNDIEKCFAQPVAGGPKRVALQAFELTAAKCSGNHSHGVGSLISSDMCQVIAALPFRGQLAERRSQRFLLLCILDERKSFFAREFQQRAITQRIGNVKT
jgi:hypothetical protein